MNIAATALNVFLDASLGGTSSAGPAAGALTNIASTVLRGDGAGSNPVTGLASGLAAGIAGMLA